MNESVLELLASVVAPHPGGLDLPARVEAAVATSLEENTLPSDVSAALDAFIEAGTEDRLRVLQQAVARSGLWTIGPEYFVALIARLTAERHLALPEAARALAAVPQTQRRRLDSSSKHLLDVADAVVEDARDGVMDIEADDTFWKALRTVVS